MNICLAENNGKFEPLGSMILLYNGVKAGALSRKPNVREYGSNLVITALLIEPNEHYSRTTQSNDPDTDFVYKGLLINFMHRMPDVNDSIPIGKEH